MKLCKRKSDGAMFRPSYPDGYDGAQAMADTLIGRTTFYFRGVRWQSRKWWQLSGCWVDTGEIWQPKSGEFDVVDA